MVEEVVFAGISLPLEDVPTAGGRVVCGPARSGDVASWGQQGVRRFLLIDGVMVYGRPPSPQEIAAELRAGATVVGASSIGALRAVELRAAPGMTGVGWVYEEWMAGRLLDDDDLVAVLDPDSHRPLTLFVVNIAYACDRAVGRGELTATTAAALLRDLRATYFGDRTPVRFRALCERHRVPDDLTDWMLSAAVDVKRRDALAALDQWELR